MHVALSRLCVRRRRSSALTTNPAIDRWYRPILLQQLVARYFRLPCARLRSLAVSSRFRMRILVGDTSIISSSPM